MSNSNTHTKPPKHTQTEWVLQISTGKSLSYESNLTWTWNKKHKHWKKKEKKHLSVLHFKEMEYITNAHNKGIIIYSELHCVHR